MKLGEHEHLMGVDTHEEAINKISNGLEASQKALNAVIKVCQEELDKLPFIKFDTSLGDTRSALTFTLNQFKHHLTTIVLP